MSISIGSLSTSTLLFLRATRYEVAWSDWKRLDGTNTTWMPNLWDRPDLVRYWKQKQNKRRRELAEENLDIEVSNFIDIHNANTFRKAQALMEKTDKRRGRPIRYGQWDIELEKNLVDRDMSLETDTWPRHLRRGAVRTGDFLTRFPSTVSASPSMSSDKDTSGSRRFNSQIPSSSRSATLFSSSNPSRGSQETLTAPTSITESRSVRALPTRAKLLSPTKTPPSR